MQLITENQKHFNIKAGRVEVLVKDCTFTVAMVNHLLRNIHLTLLDLKSHFAFLLFLGFKFYFVYTICTHTHTRIRERNLKCYPTLNNSSIRSNISAINSRVNYLQTFVNKTTMKSCFMRTDSRDEGLFCFDNDRENTLFNRKMSALKGRNDVKTNGFCIFDSWRQCCHRSWARLSWKKLYAFRVKI